MNKNVKLLSMMLSLIMCLSAFTAIFSTGAVAAACTHENSKYYGYQEPTCLVPGGDMYRCEDCGEIYALNVVPTTDHTPGPAATCTTNQTCTVCKTEIKAALGHAEVDKNKDGVADVYTEKANCSTGADEYTYTLCSVCGHKEVTPGQAGSGKHVLVADEANVIAPTCTSTGVMPYYCKNCDYTENVVILALGHNFKDVAKAPATCTKDGLEAHKFCDRCNGYFTADKAEETTKDALKIPAAHTAGAFKYTKQSGSCTADRIDVWYCSACEVYFEKNLGKVHDWATHTTPATCIKYGYTYLMCQLCGAIDEDSTKQLTPLGHQIAEGDKGTYHKATCTTGAYTEYVCLRTGCDTNGIWKVIDEKNPALGHDPKKVADKVEPTCTVPGSTAKFECQRDNCNWSDGGEAIPVIAHTYADVKYPQTCLTDGYTINECTMCGLDKAGAVAKDIVPADGVSHVTAEKITTEPTCTKAGVKTTYCKLCDKVDVMTPVPALGHDWADEPSVTFGGTCVVPAYAIYECENDDCLETDTRYGEVNTTPVGHEAAMGGEGAVIETLRAATCQVKELVRFACSACGHQYEKNIDYSVTAPHTPVTHAGYAADCTTESNGLKAGGVYCKECTAAATAAAGKQVYVWFAGKAPEVIPYEHNDVTEHDALGATCTTDGYSAFKSCTVCDAVDGAHSFAVLSTTTYKVAKLGHTGTDVVVAAKAPTCTEGGNIAYRYCSVCEKYFAKDLVDAEKSALEPTNLTEIAESTVFQPKNGHSYTSAPKTFATPKTCDQMSYTYHECTACGDKYINQFVNVKAHTWVAGTVSAPTCTEDGYTPYTCSACPATAKNVKDGDHKDALGHINAKGEIFWGLCNETVADRKCVRDENEDDVFDCFDTVCAGAQTEYTEDNEIHDYIHEKTVEATCDAYGYEMFLCANCDDQKITSYTPATGHSKTGAMDPKKQVEATYTTTGLKVWTCSHIDANTGKACGADVTEVIPVEAGLNITIEADNAVANGYNLVNGGLVQFTVALETIDLKANSLLSTFTYDGTILTFVGAKVENIFGEGTINDAHANVVNGANGAKNGTLIISSYAPNTAEGKVQDVTVTGSTTYAILTFRINKDAAGKNAELTATKLELLNTAGKQPVKPVTEDAAVVEYAPISTLGNCNGDTAINSIDTLTIRKMMSGELVIDKKTVQYSAEADVDMDGDVDLEDFARLNKYLIGAITYDQLVLNK